MSIVLAYPLITAALFYLAIRARITKTLWSHYPAWLARFLDCAACSGFWYGLLLHCALSYSLHVGFLGLAYDSLIAPVIVGLCSLVWTPIVAAWMQRSLDNLGSVVLDEEDRPHG